MTTKTVEWQDELRSGLVELTRLYEAAHVVSSELPSAFEAGGEAAHELERLAQLMSGVQDLEQQIAPLKRRWTLAGKPTSPELRQVLEQATKSLETLIASIGLAEERAQSAKQRLTPRLDAETLGRRMRAAYAANTQT